MCLTWLLVMIDHYCCFHGILFLVCMVLVIDLFVSPSCLSCFNLSFHTPQREAGDV